MKLSKILVVSGTAIDIEESKARIANGEIEVNGNVCTDPTTEVSASDCINTSFSLKQIVELILKQFVVLCRKTSNEIL